MDNNERLAQYKKQIGKRLKQARVQAGMTQAVAAAALSERGYQNKDGGPLEPSRIGNYEQGTRMPDPMLVNDLCAIYGAFSSWVFGFEEAPQSPAEAALTMKYRNTDDRGKKVIQSIADAQPGYNVSNEKTG